MSIMPTRIPPQRNPRNLDAPSYITTWRKRQIRFTCCDGCPKGVGGFIAFRLLGAPIGLIDALAIEGLLHAGLIIAVLVPGYAGVQEGGYMLLGAAFGVPPEIALGTSLLRRGRDIAIGIPVLLIWQFVELRRLRKDYGERPQ